MARKSHREKIVDAFMALLAEKPIERIDLVAIAERAEVPLDEFRAEFSSKFDVLAGFVKEIDRQVLAGMEKPDEGATARERLFDVLMRRFELLAPYRAAIESLRRSLRRDPPLALFLNRLAVRSQTWMMAAAGIDGSGLRGSIRAQALAGLFARVADTWLDDDDPGLARTMAQLDRALSRGAAWSARLDDACRMVACRRDRGWRRRRREDDGAAGEPVPAS